MIVFNTTVGWQVGDDLIRRGVEILLDVRPGTSTYYVNRAQAEVPLDRMTDDELEAPSAPWNPYHAVQRGRPSYHDVMKGARLFVCAGTPEWASMAEGWWAAAIEHRVPIALVGVGQGQGGAMALVRAAAEAGLIAVVTVRDPQAQAALRAVGVDAQWFPCPATAGWEMGTGREAVLNPRLSCAGRTVRADQLEFWKAVAADPAYAGCKVVVHEPAEIAQARALFGHEPFFSSRAQDYEHLYGSVGWYLGARLHGALPVTAAGGVVNLLDAAPKFSAFWAMVERSGVPYGTSAHRVQPGDRPPPLDYPARTSYVQDWLVEQAAEHAQYLRDHLGDLVAS